MQSFGMPRLTQRWHGLAGEQQTDYVMSTLKKKKLAQQVRTEHEQSSHVRWAFWQCMQALLAFFFFTTGLVMLTVSGMSARLRLTVVVAVMVVVMAWSG